MHVDIYIKVEAHSDIMALILFYLREKERKGRLRAGVPAVWMSMWVCPVFRIIQIQSWFLSLSGLQPTFPKVENTLSRASPSDVTNNPCFPIHRLLCARPRVRSPSLSSSTPGGGRWERWLVLTTESWESLSYLFTIIGQVGGRLGLELGSSNSGVWALSLCARAGERVWIQSPPLLLPILM